MVPSDALRETHAPSTFLSNCRMTKKRKRGPKHWVELVLAVIAIMGITWVGLLFGNFHYGGALNSELAARYGDFIGGYFGTVALIVSVALVVVTYRNQAFHAKVSEFESQFFELLRYHRDNMTEIEVDGISGRRAFVSFLREWKLLLPLIDDSAALVKEKLAPCERGKLAYIAFFNGSGPNARRTLEDMAVKRGFTRAITGRLVEIMSDERREARIAKASRDSLWEVFLTRGLGKGALHEKPPLQYIPFEGHHSRLAHYYRHLFHLVKYAEDSAPQGLAGEYVDLVAAQLTTHEQALLALHAASFGGKWKKYDYLQKYDMIKDIPDQFLKVEEFDIRAEFPKVAYADHPLPEDLPLRLISRMISSFGQFFKMLRG